MEEGETNGAIRSQVRHYKLPIMMKERDSELVVLFAARKVGTVLVAKYDEDGEIIHEVGEIADDWLPVDDKNWEPCKSVLLTQ